MFKPKAIYFEKEIENYKLGKQLLEKYKEVPKIEIEIFKRFFSESFDSTVPVKDSKGPSITFTVSPISKTFSSDKLFSLSILSIKLAIFSSETSSGFNFEPKKPKTFGIFLIIA